MEQFRESQRENAEIYRQPGEIVEVYRQPDPREVVEVYSCPLPRYSAAQETAAPVRKKKKWKGFIIFLACFAGVVLLSIGGYLILGGVRHADYNSFEQHYEEEWTGEDSQEVFIPRAEPEAGAEFRLTAASRELLSAQQVYQKVNPSVVTVMAAMGESISVGAGVIFTEDGYIVTNYHVLERATDCVVALDTGDMYEARYIAGDAGNDLAILKIGETGLPAAEFTDSDALMVGDKVYAIGNPLGVELRGTLTDGIVSAINRDVWLGDHSMTLIQTNAALNTGNSGGPLINEYGQVVGINVIKMTSKYSNVEGLGFAIPTASMERILNDLMTYGELQPEPLLGITVMTIREEAEPGVWGLRVDSVTAGEAGDLAGIRPGDFILTAEGEKLNTSQQLLRIRRRLHVGDTLDMSIWRSGKILNVTLVLENPVEETEETAPWYAQ